MTYSWFQVLFSYFVIASILHNLLMFSFKYCKIITIHVLCFYLILRKVWHLRTFAYCPFVTRIHLCFIHDRFPFFSGLYLLIVYHLFEFFEFFYLKIFSCTCYVYICISTFLFHLNIKLRFNIKYVSVFIFNCP